MLFYVTLYGITYETYIINSGDILIQYTVLYMPGKRVQQPFKTQSKNSSVFINSFQMTQWIYLAMCSLYIHV